MICRKRVGDAGSDISGKFECPVSCRDLGLNEVCRQRHWCSGLALQRREGSEAAQSPRADQWSISSVEDSLDPFKEPKASNKIQRRIPGLSLDASCYRMLDRTLGGRIASKLLKQKLTNQRMKLKSLGREKPELARLRDQRTGGVSVAFGNCLRGDAWEQRQRHQLFLECRRS